MDDQVMLWLFRAFTSALLAACGFFLMRTVKTLDRVEKSIGEQDKRLAIVEILIAQHEKLIENFGLLRLVRKRYQDMDKDLIRDVINYDPEKDKA